MSNLVDCAPPTLVSAVVGVTTLAFAVRVYHLASQSLWYDEAVTVLFSHQPLPALIASVAADNHPPLHYLLLHSWMGVAGSSEFAIRFLSVLFGVACVPLVICLGRQLVGTSTAVWAALLAAVSPMLVWYSQEARMYSLALFASLLSACAFAAIFRASLVTSQPSPITRRGWWILLVTSGVAALYSHVYSVFVLAFQNVVALALLAGRRRLGRKRLVFRWAASQLAIALAFAPWLGISWQRFETDTSFWQSALDLRSVGWQAALELTGGNYLGDRAGPAVIVGSATLLLLGLLHIAVSSKASPIPRPWAALHVGLYTFIPMLLLLGVMLVKPKFAARYLIYVQPPLMIGIAAGIRAVGWPISLLRPGRFARTLSSALVASAAASILLISTSIALTDERWAREDFRSAFRYISQHARADDAVLLVSGHTQPLWSYYGAPRPTVAALPDRLVPSVTDRVSSETVAATLNRLRERASRVWLVLWQWELGDPNRITVDMLSTQARPLDPGNQFRGLELLLFSLRSDRPFSPLPPMAHRLGITFDNEIELVGYDLDAVSAKPGDNLPLTLYWRAIRKAKTDYTAFVHLLSPAEHIYGQHDRRIVNDFLPTSQWSVGDILKDVYQLPVLSGTPPGSYQIELGLYVPSTMRRLLIRDALGASIGDRYLLRDVQVGRGEPPRPEAYSVRATMDATALGGALRLLGMSLDQSSYRPGEGARLTLLWLRDGPLEGEVSVGLSAFDRAGRSAISVRQPMVDDLYPPHLWQPGEIVRDIHSLQIPGSLTPGEYRLRVDIDSAGQGSKPVDLPLPLRITR